MALPNGIISSTEAKKLDANFNSKHQLLSNAISKPDNRSSWWSIEDIEAFIAHAKTQAKNLGYTLNGLRVYLGSYGQESKNKDYTTVFIAPTGYETGKTANNKDIQNVDLLNMGEMGWPPQANYPQ